MLRYPVVAFAFVVDQLRRIPGARQVERRAPWVVSALMLAALAALAVWAAQRSPQRISMSDLVAGKLAPMQTWIIVTGDLRAEPSTSAYRYTLTDPDVPDAELAVLSDVELPVGRSTISGTVSGGGRQQTGFAWIGQLRADREFVPEPDPPWVAIGLAAAALFVGVGSRSFYPMFFRQVPRVREPETTTLPVGVRHDWPPSAGEAVAGSLVLRRGAPVELRVADQTQQLRLHSVHSSIDVGELRRLRDSEPALVVRPASGDVTITFGSPDARDAAFAAFAADVDRAHRPQPPAPDPS